MSAPQKLSVQCLRRQCPPPCIPLSFAPRKLEPMHAVRVDENGQTLYQACSSASSSPGQSASSNSTSPPSDSSFVFMKLPQRTHSDGNRCTEIIPNFLYLGDHCDADPKALQSRGIHHVLNVAAECEDSALECADFTVKHVRLQDHSDEDISSQLEDCVEWIRMVIQVLQKPILVHCKMGFSRSASIVMAYLIRHGPNPDTGASLSFNEAWDYVKARRELVSPNLGFVLALQRWAVKCGHPSDNMFLDGCPTSPSF